TDARSTQAVQEPTLTSNGSSIRHAAPEPAKSDRPPEEHRWAVDGGLRSAALRLEPSDAVAALGRHVHLLAYGEPHVARRNAGLERLIRGAIAHARQDEVGEDRPRPGTELVLDGALELAQAHDTPRLIVGLLDGGLSAATARDRPLPSGRRAPRRGRSAGPRGPRCDRRLRA